MLDKIKEIIIEQLNLQGVEITEETSFKDDLGADSLDLFELVMAFEEEFGIAMIKDKNTRTGAFRFFFLFLDYEGVFYYN